MEPNEIYKGGEGLQWHPAIRALGWIKDWFVWAALASVLWESVSKGLRPTASLGSILTHTLVICIGLLCAIVPLLLVHNWFEMRRQVKQRYPNRRFIAIALLITTAVLGAIGGLYGWVVYWIFRWILPLLGNIEPAFARYELPVIPQWIGWILLAAAAAVVVVLLRPLPSKHASVWRLLGTRKAARGYAVMAILRLRQPRHDFFVQAPLVRDVRALALIAILHQFLEPPVVAWLVSTLLVVTSLAMTLDLLLPPAWLFLGRSHGDSFRTFDILRSNWRIFGVTLLDRDSRAWHEYYFAHARALVQHGVVAGNFMKRPGTPRVWSLRSRGDLWESTVSHLMRIAAVIVVDARAKSYYIYDEVLWLAELQWTDKAWLLGEANGQAAALDGALEWAANDNVELPPHSPAQLASRVVTEEQLYGATWSDTGLQINR